jgi:hypothetical protein
VKWRLHRAREALRRAVEIRALTDSGQQARSPNDGRDGLCRSPWRVDAAIGAGGTVVFDEFAPAWWTLADPEGNEADIATSVHRD